MKIQYIPVPDGAEWQVLLEREVTTLWCVTVDHAGLGIPHNVDPRSALTSALEARAVDLLAEGKATVIGEERPPVEIRSWEQCGSARAREALEFHTARVAADNA
ncbi:hypothetical protein L3Q67_26660 [Saccharothrix sp. AJ9571]|nr:hypothetical protein L3Q67_26660 [Saccharothrix sp. AJ9571]